MDKFEALKISDFDHLEFATADLEKASEIYLKLGFEKAGSREILERQLKSHLFVQNGIRVLVSHSTLRSDPIARYVSQHGEGMVGIGFLCEDAVSSLDLAANRGAEVADPPKSYQKDFGSVQSAAIKVFGDIRHTFISRRGNLFAEGFEVPIKLTKRQTGLQTIELIRCFVDPGQMDAVADFYERVLGLIPLPQGVGARLMRSSNGVIKIESQQPSDEASHIQEYIDINHGPGIAAVALATNELVNCVQAFLREGLKFSPYLPGSGHAAAVAAQFPHFAQILGELASLNVGATIDSTGNFLEVSIQSPRGPFRYTLTATRRTP